MLPKPIEKQQKPPPQWVIDWLFNSREENAQWKKDFSKDWADKIDVNDHQAMRDTFKQRLADLNVCRIKGRAKLECDLITTALMQNWKKIFARDFLCPTVYLENKETNQIALQYCKKHNWEGKEELQKIRLQYSKAHAHNNNPKKWESDEPIMEIFAYAIMQIKLAYMFFKISHKESDFASVQINLVDNQSFEIILSFPYPTYEKQCLKIQCGEIPKKLA
jgi:hypothetical protein